MRGPTSDPPVCCNQSRGGSHVCDQGYEPERNVVVTELARCALVISAASRTLRSDPHVLFCSLQPKIQKSRIGMHNNLESTGRSLVATVPFYSGERRGGK